MLRPGVSISCSAILLLACTRSEPTLVPLGMGPLARAQAAETNSMGPDAASGNVDVSPTRRVGASQRSATPITTQTAPIRPDKSDAGDRPDAASAIPTSTPSQRPSMLDDGQARIEEWLGVYRGNDTTVFKTTDQAERRFDDPKAKVRVERAGKARLDFVLVDSSNDQDMCKLSASVEGDTALIDPGQSCFLETEDEMTAKSRPGKALRKDRQLSLDLVLDTLMMSDETPIAGSIDYHFDGKR